MPVEKAAEEKNEVKMIDSSQQQTNNFIEFLFLKKGKSNHNNMTDQIYHIVGKQKQHCET